MSHLVVVESPTKARTIRRFLPDGYRVEASMGHVRDLPASAAQIPKDLKKEAWARLGVNVEEDFEPLYVVPPDKKKIVTELRKALKEADILYIATDEDREGESIGWHLLEILKPKVPVKRMVFHEITKKAILEALEQTRDMDRNLIDAQETRRVLDRLVGYTLSPLLWKKIAPKLSAGRVQSVSVRLLVQRETERILFVPASYWGLTSALASNGVAFGATLTHVGGTRIATGRDFDERTGRLKDGMVDGKDVLLISEDRANQLSGTLTDSPWTITSVESRQISKKPSAPFITSTLQQEANRKMRLSARDTMRVAQRLYEQGFITYMRTDSTNLSDEAITASRRAVESRYGNAYLSDGPRQYANKVRNAQEAHEAIRPAGTKMPTRDELGLSGQEGSLYDMIWKRTVASQMANSRELRVTARIESGEGDDRSTFRASGNTIEFPGFRRAYVEGSDDPDAALEGKDQPLPPLKEGGTPSCSGVDAKGHETKPPARLTDATLIRLLESEGIGRPSTYASIIDTIVGRGYARRNASQLVPTFTAFATNNLLETNFSSLVDKSFTANMEQVLDDIAAGKADAVPYLQSFFSGDKGLESQAEAGLDGIDARAVSELRFKSWEPYVVRVGRYGPYAETGTGDELKKASLPDDWAPGDVTVEMLAELVRTSNEADKLLGIHPEHDMPVFLCRGPYGHYVQLGEKDQEGKPKRKSLAKGMIPEEVTLDTGIQLLNLPRPVGSHPETGQEITADIGRYGPYAKMGSIFASLKPEDNVLTVDLDRAVALIAAKNEKNKPLRLIGAHPESGDPVEIFEGRYGPYVKHQKLNASLAKGAAVEDVTMEEALELLAARAERKGTKKKKAPARKKK